MYLEAEKIKYGTKSILKNISRVRGELIQKHIEIINKFYLLNYQ